MLNLASDLLFHGYMFRLILVTSFIIFLQTGLMAQDTIRMELGGYPVRAVVTNGDTLWIAELGEAAISPPGKAPTNRDMRQYRRLVYNIKKVYPYAKLAGDRYGEVVAQLNSLESNKAQREYLKQVEKDILAQYEEELKDLTITQGRILIKLIDRETRNTSYEVVKELRGSFQAAFWQTVARLFGSNLKVEYDPQGEDKMTEEIMRMIEMGYL